MEFFILSLVLLIVDFILILIRRDLVIESLTGSLLALPFAFLEWLFVPFYWNPRSVGQFTIGSSIFDIESIFFCIAFGGIASICYEMFLSKRERKLSRKKSVDRKFILKITAIYTLIMIVLAVLFQPYYIYAFIIGGAVVLIFILLTRRSLFKNSFIGALIFTFIYISALFLISQVFFPGWIDTAWNRQNLLLNSYILGIPLEEYLWAFSVGLLWAPFYEFVTNTEDA
ncbi:MAG: lycopene cyclase domain-containing protein [Candidatus Dojkabacteria bacterium]